MHKGTGALWFPCVLLDGDYSVYRLLGFLVATLAEGWVIRE